MKAVAIIPILAKIAVIGTAYNFVAYFLGTMFAWWAFHLSMVWIPLAALFWPVFYIFYCIDALGLGSVDNRWFEAAFPIQFALNYLLVFLAMHFVSKRRARTNVISKGLED